MPVFISYSKADRDFADRLANQLVSRKVHVWLDRWEMRVGDSLITKIQEALAGASALLVILSKASVKSEWCKKELNSGLMRELEEKRVVVLPVLVEKCTIPPFLKEKLYADFRTDFDEGLHTVLEGIARVTSEWQNRFAKRDWHTDWSIDWTHTPHGPRFRVNVVTHSHKAPYTVLLTITIVTNDLSSRWYRMHQKDGSDDIARHEILFGLEEHFRGRPGVRLTDNQSVVFTTEFAVGPVNMHGIFETRWLGTDTGGDVHVDLHSKLENIVHSIRAVTHRPDATASATPDSTGKTRRAKSSTKTKAAKKPSAPRKRRTK